MNDRTTPVGRRVHLEYVPKSDGLVRRRRMRVRAWRIGGGCLAVGESAVPAARADASHAHRRVGVRVRACASLRETAARRWSIRKMFPKKREGLLNRPEKERTCMKKRKVRRRQKCRRLGSAPYCPCTSPCA
eukprot:2528864-Pleurochrysis_carterae.AAC.1